MAEADATAEELRALAAAFTDRGVGVVAITLGAAGAYVRASSDAERLRRGALPPPPRGLRVGLRPRRWSPRERRDEPGGIGAGDRHCRAGDAGGEDTTTSRSSEGTDAASLWRDRERSAPSSTAPQSPER